MKQLVQYANNQVSDGNFQNVKEVFEYLAENLGLKSEGSIRLWAYSKAHKMPGRHAKKLESLTGIAKHISAPAYYDPPA